MLTMASRAAPSGWAKARGTDEVRRLLSAAFVHALTTVQASHEKAARWLGVTARTTGRWARAEGAVDVERLACSRQLWPHFLRCVVAMERKGRRV